MSQEQIHASAFQGASRQAALNRLCSLVKNGYLERQYVTGAKSRVLSVFSNTPKALKAIEDTYWHRITSPLCKSDSVPHDLILVSVRGRLEKLGLVTRYLTENMLQACEEFAQDQSICPFVDNNTDAVMEVTRQGAKTLVGIEFENSEKAQERYVRKLVNYYSGGRTPAIFYVCSSERIRMAVRQAEGAVVGKSSPRCFYALLSDVLRDSADCTFVDRNGAKIVLR